MPKVVGNADAALLGAAAEDGPVEVTGNTNPNPRFLFSWFSSNGIM